MERCFCNVKDFVSGNIPIKQKSFKDKYMSELLVALDSVQSQVSRLCDDALKPKSPLLKRSKAIDAFSNAEIVVEQQINVVTKIPSKPRNIKRNLKKLKNLLESIATGIEDRELDVVTVKLLVREQVLPIMSVIDSSTNSVRVKLRREHEIEQQVEKETAPLKKRIDESLNEAQSKDTESFDTTLGNARGGFLLKEITLLKEKKETLRREYEETYDSKEESTSKKQLVAYSKYEKTFVSPSSAELKELQTKGNCLPVACPIFVGFTSFRLRELDVLDSLGFDATAISSKGSDYADIALVLENQILIQFSKSAAKRILIDKYSDERKLINSSPDAQNRRKFKSRLKKATSELEKAIASSASAKGALLKVVTQHIQKLESEIESIEKSLEAIEARIKKLRHDIVLAQRETVKKSNVVGKDGRKKILLKPKAIEYHINSMLMKFSEAGRDYSLISNEFIPHPNIADIYFAWLVPTEQAKFIRNIYSDSNVVESWGFPWKINV